MSSSLVIFLPPLLLVHDMIGYLVVLVCAMAIPWSAIGCRLTSACSIVSMCSALMTFLASWGFIFCLSYPCLPWMCPYNAVALAAWLAAHFPFWPWHVEPTEPGLRLMRFLVAAPKFQVILDAGFRSLSLSPGAWVCLLLGIHASCFFCFCCENESNTVVLSCHMFCSLLQQQSYVKYAFAWNVAVLSFIGHSRIKLPCLPTILAIYWV